jgi:hypothetical protein
LVGKNGLSTVANFSQQPCHAKTLSSEGLQTDEQKKVYDSGQLMSDFVQRTIGTRMTLILTDVTG